MTRLSEEDWENLEDTYEQVNLQEAISSIDRARALLATDDEGKGLRSELLRLQTLAEQVIVEWGLWIAQSTNLIFASFKPLPSHCVLW